MRNPKMGDLSEQMGTGAADEEPEEEEEEGLGEDYFGELRVRARRCQRFCVAPRTRASVPHPVWRRGSGERSTS